MLQRLRTWWAAVTGSTEERLLPESGVAVTSDEDGVWVEYRGASQGVRWDDLVRVSIETNDSGPFASDFWWILEGPEGQCRYPQGATGEEEALDAFKEKLSGFNWDALIKASSSTDNATFVCWAKGPSSERAQR